MISLPKSLRGFNLVEAAIVLGVVGLVIGGIWVASSASRESERITRHSGQIMQIATNLRTLMEGQSLGYTGSGPDPFDSAVNTGFNATVFPGDALTGTTPQNPWGLPLRVRILILGSAGDYTPTIEFSSVMPSVGVCSKVANQLYAAMKEEKNIEVIAESDGGYGNATNDPLTAIAACKEASENLNGELLGVRVFFAL